MVEHNFASFVQRSLTNPFNALKRVNTVNKPGTEIQTTNVSFKLLIGCSLRRYNVTYCPNNVGIHRGVELGLGAAQGYGAVRITVGLGFASIEGFVGALNKGENLGRGDIFERDKIISCQPAPDGEHDFFEELLNSAFLRRRHLVHEVFCSVSQHLTKGLHLGKLSLLSLGHFSFGYKGFCRLHRLKPCVSSFT